MPLNGSQYFRSNFPFRDPLLIPGSCLPLTAVKSASVFQNAISMIIKVFQAFVSHYISYRFHIAMLALSPLCVAMLALSPLWAQRGGSALTGVEQNCSQRRKLILDLNLVATVSSVSWCMWDFWVWVFLVDWWLFWRGFVYYLYLGISLILFGFVFK